MLNRRSVWAAGARPTRTNTGTWPGHDPITTGRDIYEERRSALGCVTNQIPQTSSPIIYGLALSTPAHAVAALATALTRYRRRIGTRWRAHDVTTQAVLTIAWLEGGHTYRELGAGNDVPKSTCRTLIQDGIKVLAAGRCR
jgi:hypothetical protein